MRAARKQGWAGPSAWLHACDATVRAAVSGLCCRHTGVRFCSSRGGGGGRGGSGGHASPSSSFVVVAAALIKTIRAELTRFPAWRGYVAACHYLRSSSTVVA